MIYHKIRVLTPHGYVEEDVQVDNGVFKTLGTVSDKGIDGKGLRMIPGLFDIHTHGAVGYDFNSAKSEAEMQKILDFYASSGVTSVFPTLLTDSDEVFLTQLAMIATLAKRNPMIKGIHLEGPFLCQEYKGAQPSEFIVPPSLEKFHRYQQAAQGLVKYITIAPENPGSVEFIKTVTQEGIVVSLGHSAATFDQASAAIKAGARNFTHVMNAMAGIHQHKPSICTAAFYYDNCYNELIMDGIHVVPEMVEFIAKIKTPEKVIGITDSLMAAGLPDGEYKIGFTPILVKGGDCVLKESGVRAGSTLRLYQGFRNYLSFTHRAPETAAEVFSLNAATLFGLDKKQGSIEQGKAADYLLINESDELVATYLAGKEIYRRS